MNLQETLVLVNDLIKDKFGTDIQIGEDGDLYNKTSQNLRLLLIDGSNKPLNDQIGNFLLSQGNEDIDSLVWNALCCRHDYSGYSGKLCKMNNDVMEAKSNYEKETDDNNLTKEYSTERLVIKPLDFASRDALTAEIKQENCPIKDTFCGALECVFHHFKIGFGISLKDDGALIGYIGFYEDHSFKQYGFDPFGGIEYYIYESHRKKGYAKEALASLVDMVFSGQTIRKEESETRNYCFESRPFVFDIIKAVIDENNVGSYKTCLAAGFKEEGKISVINNGKEHYEYYLSINKNDHQIKK